MKTKGLDLDLQVEGYLAHKIHQCATPPLYKHSIVPLVQFLYISLCLFDNFYFFIFGIFGDL